MTQPLADVIRPVLAALGLELDDLTTLRAGARTLVRIAVDGDGPDGRGPTLDDVAEASKAISRALDDSDAMGDAPYVLEVGTRGVDRPLTRPAHWRRNQGRLVKITPTTGETYCNRILTSDDTGVTLDQTGRLAYADIVKAIVQVEMTAVLEGEDE